MNACNEINELTKLFQDGQRRWLTSAKVRILANPGLDLPLAETYVDFIAIMAAQVIAELDELVRDPAKPYDAHWINMVATETGVRMATKIMEYLRERQLPKS